MLGALLFENKINEAIAEEHDRAIRTSIKEQLDSVKMIIKGLLDNPYDYYVREKAEKLLKELK